MRRRWGLAVLLILAATLSGCGQTGNDTGQPQPNVETASAAEPTPDPRLQTTSLPQHGSD